MVEVPDCYGHKMHHKCLLGFESSKEHNPQGLEGFVDDIFHPVVAEMSGKTHLLHTMVDFVELPEEVYPVEENMGYPLEKIQENKENE